MSREILLLVDALAREKNVPREIVFGALESALAAATSACSTRRTSTSGCRSTARARLRRLPPLAGGSDEAGLQEPGHQ